MNTDITEITVNSDTLNEVSNKIENALTIMADKLGVASDHFYPIIVEHQLIQGWIYIWLAIPILLLATIFVTFGFLDRKRDSEASNWSFFLSIIFYIIFMGVAGSNLAQILNPEYYALMEIKDFIK